MKTFFLKINLIFVLLFIGLGLTLFETSTARAQSALDGFDPNANGTVRAIVIQPDGKIIIGGDFTALAPNGGATVTRNRIARFNPDGTLDTAFNPNASDRIFAIAVQPDGKILAGGDFTSIGGQTRNFIARLDGVTGLADSFNPNADNSVLKIVVQPDGKILTGGGFNTIGGQTRSHIARLNTATGAADSFDPNTSGAIFSIAVQADGKILAGGNFLNIGGQPRIGIARLDATTGAADSFNPNANNTVLSIVVQPDGKILAGGYFTSIGGQTRNKIARLDPITGLADSWNPNPNSVVNTIALQADGKILAAGSFNGANSIGGQARNRIARLDATTGAADSFDPNVDLFVYSIAVQSDGKILTGGQFTTFSPNGGAAVTRSNIARLERDGGVDQTLNLNAVGNYVEAVVLQSDGKIIIGGRFTSVLGQTRNNIARLNTDGTLDLSFDPNANREVRAVVVQPDGTILVGGDFSTIGGQTRNSIARLDATTGLADSFDPNTNASGFVGVIAMQVDGKILVGGTFTNIGGQPRNRIARLDPTTGLADSFNPNANNGVAAIAVQADGKIIVGGFFTNIGGATHNGLARLNAATGAADQFYSASDGAVDSIAVQSDGTVIVGGGFTFIGGESRSGIARLDTTGFPDSFDPNANGVVYSIVAQSDGKILVSGNFTNIGGQPRNNIARLNATTGAADSFDPNANIQVSSIAVQSDGKILAGGFFTAIGGQSRSLFARLANDTAAFSTLTITQNTITLTRNGSAPHFARVTFEQSTDNGATYTFLGNGTPSFAAPQTKTIKKDENGFAPSAPQASGYTLTGLNLPGGQNILIRARGFYRTGYQNGSETIEDKVQNAFLSAPTAASVTIGGRVLAGKGRGLANARVYLTDSAGETRVVPTNSFGYFRFADVGAGQTIIISVVAKRFTFAPQVVSVTEDFDELIFMPQ